MPKVYIASRTEQVDFERVCSNCEHKWTATFDLGVRGQGASSKAQASKSAETMMYVEKKDRFENREGLCPQCSHFSVNAMYRHFRKGGYAAGIFKQYKRAVWENLFGFLGFVWIPRVLKSLSGMYGLAGRCSTRCRQRRAANSCNDWSGCLFPSGKLGQDVEHFERVLHISKRRRDLDALNQVAHFQQGFSGDLQSFVAAGFFADV
jgi:hypothetical protein